MYVGVYLGLRINDCIPLLVLHYSSRFSQNVYMGYYLGNIAVLFISFGKDVRTGLF